MPPQAHAGFFTIGRSVVACILDLENEIIFVDRTIDVDPRGVDRFRSPRV